MPPLTKKKLPKFTNNPLHDPQNAIKFYLSAADRFSIDDSVAIAQGCSIKAATICGEIGKYEEAAELFEKECGGIGKRSIKEVFC